MSKKNKRAAQLPLVETVGPESGSVDWWLAEEQRAPLDDGDLCEVSGAVLAELLRVYREHQAARST